MDPAKIIIGWDFYHFQIFEALNFTKLFFYVPFIFYLYFDLAANRPANVSRTWGQGVHRVVIQFSPLQQPGQVDAVVNWL